MSDSITITATTLRNFSKCHRLVWLDRFGDYQQRDQVSPVAMIRGVRHEEDIQAATTDQVETTLVGTWDEGVEITRTMIDDGVPIIVGGFLEHAETLVTGQTVTLHGKTDQLIRARVGSSGVYRAIEIKQYTKLTEADYLQLDLYLHLLEQAQNRDSMGVFWLGKREDGLPQDEVEHHLRSDQLPDALVQTAEILTQQTPPPVHLVSHCRSCHWYSGCFENVKATLDISLLPRLRSQTQAVLRQAGITTLDQFASLSIEELQQFKGIKTTAFALKANAQAYVENRPVWFNEIPEVLNNGGWMLDLETAALAGGDGLPWAIGWSDQQGRTQITILVPHSDERTLELLDGQIVHIVPDVDALWQCVYDSVSVDDKPIYHWTGFDAGVLQSTAPDPIRKSLGPRMHDLHRTFINTVRLPQKSYSIKKVAAYFGFSWSGYQEWWQAETDYRIWLDTGEIELLAQACAYQRDDVIALVEVWSWLVTNNPD